MTDRPLRVAHLIAGLQVGGAEQMLARLVGSLASERVESLVISISEPGPIGDLLESEGVQVVALGLRMGIPDLRTPARVARTLRQWRADVLQTWLYHADVMGGLGGWLARVPVVWNVRQTDLSARTTRGITRVAALASGMWSGWLPRRIVCVSHATRAAHVAIGYDAARIEVIPNGFDTAQLRPDPAARVSVRRELGIPADAPVVGHVARFDPAKGHDHLLRAARYLPTDTHIVMCGRGVTPQNRTFAQLLAVHEAGVRLHLLGERTDIPRLTAAFDVVVSPSRSEGFSNAIGEAMASGVPVVATDVGDSARVIGDTGRVVAPDDPPSLAAALRHLLADREERQALGTRARSRIEREYSLAAVARHYEELWSAVAGRSGAGGVPRHAAG